MAKVEGLKDWIIGLVNRFSVRRKSMLAIKAQYAHGRIKLLEPMPADIVSAELNIIVIPLEEKKMISIPADAYRVQERSSEYEFRQIGLAAFFDTDDDANVDWEDCFGLK